jgi:hypothetical protein
MHRLTPKLVFPIADELAAQSSVPLAGFCVLPSPTDVAESICLKRLSRRQAFVALTENTFNSVVADAPRLARQFTATAEVAGRLPVFALARPRGLALLRDTCALIAAQFSD